jgi:subtilisin family serine protease
MAAESLGPEPKPLLPPAEAYARGWMPLRPTGVPEFLARHPTYDGRGVLIAILDSGVDAGIPGLGLTTTGETKLLDLRDFSGEGTVALSPVTPVGDQVTVAGRVLTGVSRLRTIMVGTGLWAGSIAEIPLGQLPAADLNGDRDDADTLAVVVVRASDGWVLYVDTDGDGSLANERPIHDYLRARETFAWRHGSRPPTITLAANFREEKGAPRLDLYFDTSAHGSHVAGIAAGHDIYGVKGFNGVAPGAYLLGIKIADNANGGISTTGSMVAGIGYAIRFAQERRLPLVINVSFGVGNEREGQARIDRIIDSVLARHPEVVVTISAGNDGPGLSTMGYPGSVGRAITVGATFPAVFLGASGSGRDPVAYFSSRGGELAKPEIVTPGMAYSTVPRWDTGDERKGGTSMAAPHAAGLAALLMSGLAQEGRTASALQIRQALMVTAGPIGAGSFLDQGTGQPDVGSAWRWLQASRPVPEVQVLAGTGATAGWLELPPGRTADTAQLFRLELPAASAVQEILLRPGADWLEAPGSVTLQPGSTTLRVGLRAAKLGKPGVYTGVVAGWTRDTLLGPVVRLVTTVVVPDTGQRITAELGRIAAGGTGRRFFRAEAGRPFAVSYATAGPGELILAYLHEPGGQPYREDNGAGAGYGEQGTETVVDARDVVPGLYEAVAVASPLDAASGRVQVVHSPFRIAAARTRSGVEVALDNLTANAVSAAPFGVLVGGERSAVIVARGSERQRIRFALPSWAVHAAVDVSMDTADWPRFTDFGVTLLDGAGRQLGKAPMNYAFGRLHVSLPPPPPGDSAATAELDLLPGFADPGADARWTARVSIRLYTDSAHVERMPGRELTVPAGQRSTLTLPFTGGVLPLGDAFVPLGIIVVPAGDRTWTLETPLPAPITPLTP